MVVVAVVALVAGYGVVRRTLTIRGVDRHERQWERAGIDDYTFHLELQCFCAQRNFDVTVTDGRVTATDPVDRTGDTPTIDDLFDVARDAVRERARSVEVSYDAADGHPTRVAIDESAGVADDEIAYLVTDLRPTSATNTDD